MSGFTGTLRLVRLALRRDRVTLPAWILGLSVFLAATTAMFVDSFTLHDNLVEETALVVENAGMRMIGLVTGASVGGYTLHRDYVTVAVLAGLMSTFAVVRHTRQNEELGRAELVGAGVVGRYAGLTAAVAVAVAANLVLAVLLALAMIVNDQPVQGSFAAGVSVAGVGLAFVGVAAVATQLASTTRGASGLAGAALGMSFLLSGAGNILGTVDTAALRVTSAWPAWLSPIGWGQQMRPFGGDQWLPASLFVVTWVLLVAIAFLLVARRDLGRGMWPERTGRARGSALLTSPVGLGWRLQRGAVLGWTAGMLGFGLVFGALSDQIDDLSAEAQEWYESFGGADRIVEAYSTSMIEMAAMAAAIYVVQILLRLRADEAGGTLEPVLTTGVSRSRWVAGYVVNAVVGAVILMLVFAVSMGVTAGLTTGDPLERVRVLTGAALVQLPGILVLGAAVVALVGFLPRWAAAVAWPMVVAALVLGPMFGPTLRLPQWLQDLSPFTHLPKVPADSVAAAPLLVLTVTCLALAAAGVLAIRRRDLVLSA